MSEHTPGPWTALDTTKSTFGMGSVVAALGQTTGGVHWCVAAVGEYVRDEELEANAYLIEAAPDLLEAAKGLTDGPLTPETRDAAMLRLIAAIDKAEGKRL